MKPKNNKGITMISLVIAVVILIILSVVVIMNTAGIEGLGHKAETSKYSFQVKQDREAIEVIKQIVAQNPEEGVDAGTIKKVALEGRLTEPGGHFISVDPTSESIPAAERIILNSIPLAENEFIVKCNEENHGDHYYKVSADEDIDTQFIGSLANFPIINIDKEHITAVGSTYTIPATVTCKGGIKSITLPDGTVVEAKDFEKELSGVKVEKDGDKIIKVEFKAEVEGEGKYEVKATSNDDVENSVTVQVGDSEEITIVRVITVSGTEQEIALTDSQNTWTNEEVKIRVKGGSERTRVKLDKLNGEAIQGYTDKKEITYEGNVKVTAKDGSKAPVVNSFRKFDNVMPEAELTIPERYLRTDGFTVKVVAKDGEATDVAGKSGLKSVELIIKHGNDIILDKTDCKTNEEAEYVEIPNLTQGETYTYEVIVTDNAGNVYHSTPKSIKLLTIYTVTYKGNGGKTLDNKTEIQETKQENTNYEIKENTFLKPGYTFEGWNTAENGAGTKYLPHQTYYADANLDIYAIWSANKDTRYKVIHKKEDLEGNFVVAEERTYFGTTDEKVTPALNTYQGFTAKSEPQEITINGEGTSEVTYEYSRNEYTLTVIGDTGIETVTGGGKHKFEAPVTISAVAKPGYTYTNLIDVDTNEQVPSSFKMPARNVTIRATATAHRYTVVFDGNGATSGTMENQSFVYDEPQALRENAFSRTGYTFKGWNGLLYYNEQEKEATTREFLQYADLAPYFDRYGTDLVYELEFDLKSKDTSKNNQIRVYSQNGSDWKYNLGAAASPVTVTTEYQHYVLELHPTRSTYNTQKSFLAFYGTYNTGNFPVVKNVKLSIKEAHFEDKEIVKNLTTEDNATVYLPADWEANKYQVTVNAGAGTIKPTEGWTVSGDGKTATKEVSYDSTYKTLPDVERPGYDFDGWYTAENGGNKIEEGAKVEILADQTLYAHYTAKKYNVTFDSNGGNEPNPTSKEVTYDSPYGDLAEVTRTGYTFKGWYTSAEDGTEVTPTTLVSTAKDHTLTAIWEANKYEVTLKPNGGMIPSTTGWTGSGSTSKKEVTYDGTYGTLPTPQKSGYKFEGWYTSAEGGTEVTKDTKVETASNHEIFAHYTANSYEVTFDSNGGNTPNPVKKTVTYDAPYGNLAEVSKTGYDFKGWSLNRIDQLPEEFEAVEYIESNGTQYIDTEYKPGPNTGIETTYQFNALTQQQRIFGVSSTSSVEGTISYDYYISSGNVYSWAYKNDVGNWSWTNIRSDLNKHTLYFNVNNRQLIIDSADVFAKGLGNAATNTSNASLPIFARYVLESGAITGKAKAKLYTFKIYENGEMVRNYIPCKNKTTGEVGLYEVMQGKFYGKATGNEFTYGTNVYVTAESIVKTPANHTLYADWEAKKYTVTYNVNGGNALTPASKEVTYDANYGDLPTPTRTGYTFAGWYTLAEDGTEVTKDTKVTNANNHEIFAHWNINQYYLTYDYQDTYTYSGVDALDTGFKVDTSKNIKIEATFIVSTAGQRYCIFGNLSGASTVNVELTKANKLRLYVGSNYKDLYGTTALTAGTEVRVVYTWNATTKEFKLVSSDGTTLEGTEERITGIASNNLFVGRDTRNNVFGSIQIKSFKISQEYDYNTVVTSFHTPTKPGYTYTGWYETAENGTALSGVTIPAENKTIYAHKTANKYIVTYNINGGNALTPATKEVTYDSPYGTLPEASRTGYTFKGWFTEAENGTEVKADTKVTNANNHEIFAHWEANKYEVTLNPNGGNVSPNKVEVTYDSTYSNLPTPTKEWYTFDGWYTLADGGDKIEANTVVKITGAQTLYAHWIKTEAKFLPGQEFNAKLKQIVNENNTATYSTKDTTLTAFERSATLDVAVENATIISANDSQSPIYAWKDGSKVKYYSTAEKPHMNENASYMFNELRAATTLDIDDIDTSKTENMSYLFHDCLALTELNVGTFNTANVTNMSYMFAGDDTNLYRNNDNRMNLTKIDGLTSFNTSKVENMSHMFYYCLNITELNLSSFDTSKVKDMSYMFAGNWYDTHYPMQLNSIIGIEDFNTQSVETFNGIFDECQNITSLNLSKWNTSNAKDMTGMFMCNYELTNLDISNFDTSNVTTTYRMFWLCKKITSLDISNFDMNKVTRTENMLGSMTALTELKTPNTYPASVRLTLPKTMYDPSANAFTEIGAGTTPASPTETWLRLAGIITFNANGGEGEMAAQPVVKEVETQINTHTFTRTGYTFVGWNTKANGTGTPYTENQEVKNISNMTLYAQWEASKYIVTVNAGEGTIGATEGWTIAEGNHTATKEVTYDSLYGTLPEPTRTGYDFAGWYTSQEGGNKVEESTKVETADNHEIFAHWVAKKYTVTFDSNGGNTSNPESKEVTYDSAYGDLAQVQRPGYTFQGWNGKNLFDYDNNQIWRAATTKETINGEKVYKRIQSYNANIWPIFYTDNNIKFEENKTYTISFDIWADKEAEFNSNRFYINNKTTTTINLDKITTTKQRAFGTLTFKAATSGSQILHIYPKTSDDNNFYVSNILVEESSTPTAYEPYYVTPTTLVTTAKDHTLTAVWEANPYTVTYDANGGTVSPASKEVTYDAPYGELATPVRAGYTFKGWYREAYSTYNYNISFTDAYSNKVVRISPTAGFSNEYGYAFAEGDELEFDVTIEGTTVLSLDINDLTVAENLYTKGETRVQGRITLTSAMIRGAGYNFLDINCSELPTSYTITTFKVHKKIEAETIVKTPENHTLTAIWADEIKPTKPSIDLYHTAGGAAYTSGTWTNKEVASRINSVDEGSGIVEYQYTLDNGTTWNKLTNATNNIQKLADNKTYQSAEGWEMTNNREITVQIRAVDAAGNISEPSDEFIIRYDTVAATLDNMAITSQAGAFRPGADIELTATFSENIYGTAVEGGNEAITAETAPVLKIKFGDGAERTATFKSVDGNKIKYTYKTVAEDNGKLTTSNYTGDVYDRATNKTTVTNIEVTGSDVFADITGPVITAEDITYGETLSIKLQDDYAGLTGWKVVEGEVTETEDTGWTTVTKTLDEVTVSKAGLTAGKHTICAKDDLGNISYKTITVAKAKIAIPTKPENKIYNGAVQQSGITTPSHTSIVAEPELVINGDGSYGDNTNFTQWQYDENESYNGSNGSFKKKSNYTTLSTNEFFAVSTSEPMTLSFDAKSDSGTANFTAFIGFFDLDKKTIAATVSMFIAGTTTTLARDLHEGDTVVYLTNLSGWSQEQSAVYRKGFIIWDTTNSEGYTYPAETFSTNVVSDIYDDANSINVEAGTITLNKPWPGKKTIPAGTPVSQSNSGGTYRYLGTSTFSTEWKHYTYTLPAGIDYTGRDLKKYAPESVYGKVGFLWNNANADDTGYITNVSVKGKSVTSATNAGTYSIAYTLDDPDNYEWEDGTITLKTVPWIIRPYDITENGTVDALPNVQYTGNAYTPNPTVGALNATLVNNTDYSLTYKDNTNAGTAHVYVWAKGNYEGTKEVTFNITKVQNPINISGKQNLVYDGTAQELITVSNAAGDVYYSIGDTPLTAENHGTNKNIPTGTNVGTYKVQWYVEGDENHESKSGTIEVTIGKGNLEAPTVSIDEDGVVTWTNVTIQGAGEVSYEVSYDNKQTWTVATSGETNIVNSTTGTGSKEVFVRAVTNSENYNEKGTEGSKAVDIWQLTLTKGTGIYAVNNGGTNSTAASSTKRYVSGKQVAINATVGAGYTWESWNKTAGSAPVSATTISTSVKVEANTALTAVATVNNYTLTFDANGGTVSTTTKQVTYGETYTDLPTPTRTGYTFKGWYAEFNGTASTAVNLGRAYMYTDKLSIHLSAYKENWGQYGQLISCTEAGGFNIEAYTNAKKINFAAYEPGVGYKTKPTDITWASLASGWHDFDMVFDGNYVYGYLDGEKIYTSDKFNSGKIGYNAANSIFIGAEATGSATVGSSPFLNGYIGNIVIAHDDQLIPANTYNTIVAPAQDLTLKARWEAKKATVTYNVNGGNAVTPANKEVTYDSVYGELPVPTRTGYAFKGWFTDSSNGTEIKADTIVTNENNHEIFAHWEANKYTAKYNVNGGNALTPASKEVTYDLSYGDLAVPSKTGYDFKGWILNLFDKESEDVETGKYIYGNGTLQTLAEYNTYRQNIEAGKTYTIVNSGKSTGPGYVIYDAEGTRLAGENYANKAVVTFTTPANSAYIKFSVVVKQTSNNRYDKDSFKLLEGDSATPAYTVSTTKVTTPTDHTLMADWEAKKLTVTFDKNGGNNPSVPSKEVTYDEAFGDLATVTRTGYDFAGWYTDKTNGTKIEATTKVQITENQTLYAHWTAKKFTVTLNAGDGTIATTEGWTVSQDEITANKEVTYDGTYGTLPTASRTGYTFVGWYTEETNGTKIEAGTQVKITDAQTLYAHYTINQYTLTINPNGGTFNGKTTATTVTQNYDTTYNVPNNATREGFVFGGWILNAGNGDITYYTEDKLLKQYVIDSPTSPIPTTYRYSSDSVTVSSGIIEDEESPTGYAFHVTTTGKTTKNAYGIYNGNTGIAGTIYYHKVIANVPVGYTLAPASNQTGIGYGTYWITANKGEGTGHYETYIYAQYTGYNGVQSTFGHIGVTGTGTDVTVKFAESKIYKVANNLTELQAYNDVFKFVDSNATLTAVWNYSGTHVLIDKQGGTFGNGTIGAKWTAGYVDYKYQTAYTGVKMPRYNSDTDFTIYKKGYTFDGFYTEATGGTQVFGTDGKLIASVEGYSDSAKKWQRYDPQVTLYARWIPNPLTFEDQTLVAVSYDPTDSQTLTIQGASNGTGSYTYTEVSESKGGTATNYITINGTTITLAAGTPAGVYEYQVKAHDNDSGSEATATITITVNKVANEISVTTKQGLIYNTTAQDLVEISGASGDVYYSISNTPLSANNYQLEGTKVDSTHKPEGTDAGTYKVQIYVAGDENHEPKSETVEVTIGKYDLSSANMSQAEMIYTGSQLKPNTEVTVNIPSTTNKTTLVKDIDFEYSYGENINPGEDAGSVTITAKDDSNYTGTKTINFTIIKVENPANITGNDNLIYNGSAQNLITVTGAETDVYYSIGNTELNASNYNTIGTKIDSTHKPEGTNAGTYKVNWYVLGNGIFGEKSGSVEVSIAKANNPLSANDTTKYVQETIDVSSLVTASEGTLSYAIKSQTTYGSTISGSIVTLGVNYTDDDDRNVVVTISAAESTNYKSASVDITITVEKYDRELSISNLTEDQEIPYNQEIDLETISEGEGGTLGTVTFTSDNTSAITVNGRKLKAIDITGTATITATRASTTTVKAATAQVTVKAAKGILDVTVTGYDGPYNGSTHQAIIKVTSAGWNGKIIESGETNSYGESISTNALVNMGYGIRPTYRDYTDGPKTIYFRITGGDYFSDYEGTAIVNVTKTAATNTVSISGNNKWNNELTASVSSNSNGTKLYQWWSATEADGSDKVNIAGATSYTYKIPKELVGKYIGVTVNIAEGTNWYAAPEASDITDNSHNTTAQVAKQTLNVSAGGITTTYNGTEFGGNIKVTSAGWDGKIIESGSTTDYGLSVTTNGSYNSTYSLLPKYKDFTNGAKVVYYKVTGGTYYLDKTGTINITINKKALTSAQITAYTTTLVDGASTYSREISTGVGTDKVTLTYTPYQNSLGTYTYATTAGSGKFLLSQENPNYSISSAGNFTIADAPSCTISASPSGNPTNANSITYTFTWSKELKADSFTASDITVTNGTKGTLTATTANLVYQMTVTGINGGNHKILIPAGACQDTNNINNIEASRQISVDKTNPTISVSPASATVSKTKAVTISVSDSGGSGISNENIYEYYLSTSSTTLAGGVWSPYAPGQQLTLGDSKNGTFYLFVKRVLDNVGNVSTSSGTATVIDGVTYQRFGPYVFDNNGPTVSNIKVTSPTAGTYKEGQELTIVVSYNEAVYGTTSKGNSTSTTAPTLKLRFGEGDERTATFSSTSATGMTITYTYVIQDGDNGLLELTEYVGGTVYDAVGNQGTVNVKENTGNAITADTGAPTITANNITYGNILNITLLDTISGMKDWQVVSETSETAPTSGWTSISGAPKTATEVSKSGLNAGSYMIWARDTLDNVSHVAVTVSKATLASPTVTINDTTGEITWTDVTGATSYQIRFATTGSWTTATSGTKNIITDTEGTGSKTAYVRALSTNTNYTSESTIGSAAKTIRSLTLNSGTGILGVTGGGRYINGKQVSIDATVKEGYTWANWTRTAGTAPTNANNKSTTVKIQANTTLQANATANHITVTLNAQGGHFRVNDENVETITKDVKFDSIYGKDYDDNDAPLPTPETIGTKDGYEFKGWYTDATNGTKVEDTTQVTNASNHTLYAHWEKAIYVKLYDDGTLAFSYKDETFEDQTVSVDYGNIYGNNYTSASQVPWYANRNDIEYILINRKIYPTTTSYWFNDLTNVVWADVNRIQGDDLTDTRYMFNNCSSLQELILAGIDMSHVTNVTNMLSGMTALYSLVTPEEYPSNGTKATLTNTMYYDLEHGYTQIGTDTVDTNTLIRARYKVVFDPNGGVGSMEDEYALIGEGFLANPNTFTREGYVFDKWTYEKPDGTTGEIENEGWDYSLTENPNNVTVTLYANWKKKNYTVVFNGNGATSGSMESQEFTYNEAQALSLNQFAKEGYSFVGWSRQELDSVELNDKQEYTATYSSANSNGFVDITRYVIPGPFEEGDIYRLDLDVKGNGNISTYFHGDEGFRQIALYSNSEGENGTEYRGKTQVQATSTYRHYTVFYTLGSTGNSNVNKRLAIRLETVGTTGTVKNIRLEKVNTNVDWKDEFTGTYVAGGATTQNDIKRWPIQGPFAAGDEYTLEFDAKGSGTLANYFYGNTEYLQVANWERSDGQSGTDLDGRNHISLTDNYNHYKVKFTLGSSGDGTVRKQLLFRMINGESATIKNVILYKSKVAIVNDSTENTATCDSSSDYENVAQYNLSAPFSEGDKYIVEFETKGSGTLRTLFPAQENTYEYKYVDEWERSDGASGYNDNGQNDITLTSTYKKYTITYTLGATGDDLINKRILFRALSSTTANVRNIKITKVSARGSSLYTDGETVENIATDGTIVLNAMWVPTVYVKAYSDGHLVFSNNNSTDSSFGTLKANYGEIYGKDYLTELPPWTSNSDITIVKIQNKIILTSANKLFEGMSTVTNFESLANIDVSRVSGFHNMFKDCSSWTIGFRDLTQDESEIFSALNRFSGWKTSRAVDMEGMFQNCSSIRCLNLQDFNMTNVTNVTNMLSGMTLLKELKTPWKFPTDENVRIGLPFLMYINQTTGYYSINKDVLINRWLYTPVTVTLNANGGSASKTSITAIPSLHYGAKDPLPQATKSGNNFKGWYTKASGGEYRDNSTIVTNRYDHTLVALYETSSIPVTIEHYQMNTSGAYPSVATASETINVTRNATITAANYKKTYTGFTYKEARVGNTVITTRQITDAGVTIKLYYSRNQYKFTLGSATGANTRGSTLTGNYYYGETIQLNGSANTGYTWTKWASSNTTLRPDISTAVTSFKMPAGAVTMTPQVAVKSYTVKFNANGGTVSPTSKTGNYGTAITLPTPTREGFEFAGWYTNPKFADGTLAGNAGATYTIKANVTLYARWTIILYTSNPTNQTVTAYYRESGTGEYGYIWLPAGYKITYEGRAYITVPTGKTTYPTSNSYEIAVTEDGYFAYDTTGGDIRISIKDSKGNVVSIKTKAITQDNSPKANYIQINTSRGMVGNSGWNVGYYSEIFLKNGSYFNGTTESVKEEDATPNHSVNKGDIARNIMIGSYTRYASSGGPSGDDYTVVGSTVYQQGVYSSTSMNQYGGAVGTYSGGPTMGTTYEYYFIFQPSN